MPTLSLKYPYIKFIDQILVKLFFQFADTIKLKRYSMQYNHVLYMRRIYTVYKTDFWKVEICCGLPILGSKGREPRKGTFMSSAIF